jgi:hypothetical protein
MVITVAAMLSRGGWVVDGATRGGGGQCTALLLVGDVDNKGWDLPPPLAAGAKGADTTMPPTPPTNNGINKDNEGSGQCDKKGRVDDDDNKQQEQLVDVARQEGGER